MVATIKVPTLVVVYDTLIVAEIVEVFSEFYETQTFIAVFTQDSPVVCTMSQMNSVSITPFCS